MGHIIKTFGPGGSWGRVKENDDGTRDFEKWVNRRGHFHRNSKSWAIQAEIVDDLKKLGVELMMLHVQGEEDLWTYFHEFNKFSTIDRFIDKQGRDHGEQAFLHESYWRK